MGSSPPPLYGLVLSGGRSRRFGRDKAAIAVDGAAMLERMVALLDDCCEQTFVSIREDQGDDQLRRQFKVLVDAPSLSGPLAGLLTAQATLPEAAWLVVPCDLPLLDAASVRRLINARRADRAATAYRNPARGFPEPLCAIWEPATLAGLRDQAVAGQSPSPRDWLAGADTLLIDAVDAGVLENMNTPDDFKRLGLENESPTGRKHRLE